MKKREIILLLDTLAAHEKALSKLYQKFSEQFHRTWDLWTDLSKYEDMHRQWIQKMKSLYEQGKLEVNPDRITMMSVKTSIEYIEKQIQRADSGRITEANALAIASNLERAMIDERYFRMLSSADARFAKVNEKLERATELQKARLTNTLQLEERGEQTIFSREMQVVRTRISSEMCDCLYPKSVSVC
jgi:hypothetical protein